MMFKLFNYVKLENIINFECFENFPNSECMSLIFPIRKAPGPLPKITEKIPGYRLLFREFSFSKLLAIFLNSQVSTRSAVYKAYSNYSPALKKWGYTGFTLSFRRSVLPIFRYSVHKSVTTRKL